MDVIHVRHWGAFLRRFDVSTTVAASIQGAGRELVLSVLDAARVALMMPMLCDKVEKVRLYRAALGYAISTSRMFNNAGYGSYLAASTAAQNS